MPESWHAGGTAPADVMAEIERLRDMIRSLASERDDLRERTETAEAQLAEVRQAIAVFFTHHGNSAVFALQSARDLAEGIRQVLDRTPLEALSAVCTGPDCGEQFADSETSEYLFATRERMERLLYADGWASDPVLCPACQEEAAGQIGLIP